MVRRALGAVWRETENVAPLAQRTGHELYVLVQVYAELLGAPHYVFPVHGRREGLLLHLLAHALRFESLEALGAHEGAGDDEAGELVHGVEGLQIGRASCRERV